jgi:hypothetical protein
MNKFCIAVMVVMMACGASARQKEINTALSVTNTARDAFHAWSLPHERAILAASKDDATFKTEIAKYRNEQVKVEQLFAAVYNAIAAAATVNDQQSITSLEAAGLILTSELKDLGVIK